MNKYLKNTLIIIFVPSALAGMYYGYVYYDRYSKQKKALKVIDDALQKIANKSTTPQPDNMKDVAMSEWKTELKKLSDDSFKSFYDYLNITLPFGKNPKDNTWNYQTTNSTDYNQKKASFDKYSDDHNKTKILQYFQHLVDNV